MGIVRNVVPATGLSFIDGYAKFSSRSAEAVQATVSPIELVHVPTTAARAAPSAPTAFAPSVDSNTHVSSLSKSAPVRAMERTRKLG